MTDAVPDSKHDGGTTHTTNVFGTRAGNPLEWYKQAGFAGIGAFLLVTGAWFLLVDGPRERDKLREQVGVLSVAADRRNDDANRRHVELLLEVKGVTSELRRAVDALHSAGVKFDRAAKEMEQGVVPAPRVKAEVTGPGG